MPFSMIGDFALMMDILISMLILSLFTPVIQNAVEAKR